MHLPHQILNIMCCTGPDSYYTKNPRKYLFGIHRSSLDYPKAFLSQMNLRGKKHVAILFNEDVGFTISTADSAESFALNIGLNVTHKLGFPGRGYTAGAGKGHTTLRQHVQTIVRTITKPFALVFCTLVFDGHDAAMLVDELGIDADAVWISVAPTLSGFASSVGARAAEFSFAPTQWDATMQFVDPVFGSSEAYVERYRQWMGSPPNYLVASGTAAGVALQLAIESAASLAVEDVTQAFRELRADTFFGQMAFNRYQRNYGGFTATIEIVNGKVAAVLPDMSARVQLVLPPSRALRAQCPEATLHDNFTACSARLQDEVRVQRHPLLHRVSSAAPPPPQLLVDGVVKHGPCYCLSASRACEPQLQTMHAVLPHAMGGFRTSRRGPQIRSWGLLLL